MAASGGIGIATAEPLAGRPEGCGRSRARNAVIRHGACLASSLAIAAVATAAPFAYIPNQGSNDVSVIDAATNAVVATVAVGRSPCCVAVNRPGKRAYVANSGTTTISVIDTSTNAVATTIELGTFEPAGIAVSPDGMQLYVGDQGHDSLHVFDTATNTEIATVPVGSDPNGIATNPTGTRVYVANGYSNNVSVIDTATNKVAATIAVDEFPAQLALDPTGQWLYVSNYLADTVSVIDTSTNAVVAAMNVDGGPQGIVVSRDGSKVYVTSADAGSVSVIDAGNRAVVSSVSVGSLPVGMAIEADGSRIYVANADSDSASVVDTATEAVVATIPVGSSPFAVGDFITKDRAVTALSPVQVWAGLRNGDDQGTSFDIRAELLKNGVPVAAGLQRCIAGLVRDASRPTRVVVAFNALSSLTVAPAEVIAVRLSARIGTTPGGARCTGAGGNHASAQGLRVYYDGADRPARFGMAVSPESERSLFLRSDGSACPNGGGESVGVTRRFLDATAPPASAAKCKDSGAVNFGAGANPFSTIGTWSLTPLP